MTILSREMLDLRNKEKMEQKQKNEDYLRSTFKPYDGDVDKLKRLKPSDELTEAGWNKSHLFPVMRGESVYLHPDQSGIGGRYLRVVYHDRKFVAILSKNYFEKCD